MAENNLSSNNAEYVCTLPPELVEKAEAELNERPQWRDRDVLALRQMVNDSSDLRCPTDYSFLLRFLRAKKFDYDRAFASLRRYYDVRGRYQEIFANFLPSSVQVVLDAGVINVLPNPDAKGRRIIWFRPGLWNPDDNPIADIMKTMLLSLDWIIRDEKVQINGIVFMEDAAGVGWKQFRHLHRDRLRMMTYIIQEAFPIRLKAMHIINAPAFMQYVLSIIRLFLKQKLRERIYIHGASLAGLFEDLGEWAIPTEYGGHVVVDPRRWRNEMLSPESEGYFRGRLGDGYVDAARKFADAGRRLSASSLTFPGTSPLLVEQQSNVIIKQVNSYEDSLAFSSLAVCQASTDSD